MAKTLVIASGFIHRLLGASCHRQDMQNADLANGVSAAIRMMRETVYGCVIVLESQYKLGSARAKLEGSGSSLKGITFEQHPNWRVHRVLNFLAGRRTKIGN